jgi:hypothetical protein
MEGSLVDGTPPEGIPLTGFTFEQGAQMAEGVGSGATPAHPALEPSKNKFQVSLVSISVP